MLAYFDKEGIRWCLVPSIGMERTTTVDADDGLNERPDLQLTVEVAGRRLVYATGDLETVAFSASEL